MSYDHINLPLPDMAARLDVSRHVAVPYYRDERLVFVIQFESTGPVTRQYPADEFDRTFKLRYDMPMDQVSLKFIKAVRSCYLPGSRVINILMEIYIMSTTNGTNDLETLSQSALTEAYNKLAAASERPTVKGFKDKKTAIDRIKKLQEEASTPSEAQKRAQKAKDEEAALKPVKPAKTEKPLPDADEKKERAAAFAMKTATKKEKDAKEKEEKQKAAKAKADARALAKGEKPAPTEKKQRGLGIGAFCTELIKAGKTNDEILAAVKAKHPDASTSVSSIAWYRNKIKSEEA